MTDPLADLRVLRDGDLTADEAAAYVGVKASRLWSLRAANKGPRSRRVIIDGHKRVVWRKVDLDAWCVEVDRHDAQLAESRALAARARLYGAIYEARSARAWRHDVPEHRRESWLQYLGHVEASVDTDMRERGES